jgi:hypothetical protein
MSSPSEGPDVKDACIRGSCVTSPEEFVREKRIAVVVCAVCGNEKDSGPTCRFCGARQKPEAEEKSNFIHKTINLEHGRPFVAEAIKKLLCEIQAARIEQVRVLTVIHGYGSSGKGGAIRDECRKSLDYLLSTGEIKGYIPGEDFSSRAGLVKALLRQFPELTNNRNLDRRNPGVTLVIMK